VLDVSYPGGTDTFMQKMCQPDIPARLVCADEKLVSVSFLLCDDARVVARELCELGILAAGGDEVGEFAFVDQAEGPTARCDWLEWRRHPDGFTYCWLAGSDPDDMHAPENWTPEQSRALTRSDIRDEPGRFIRLAVEEDGEVWLDYKTGEISEGVPPRTAEEMRPESVTPSDSTSESSVSAQPAESDVAPSALMEGVATALEEQGYHFARTDPRTIQLSIRNVKSAYSIAYTANDQLDLVEMLATFGSSIPLERRAAIAELASRMNVLLRLGNFELDFASGVLRFRATSHVPGGALTGAMVRYMLAIALHMMDQNHDAIMRVAFGNISPDVAL
jgi:hypothetical protein